MTKNKKDSNKRVKITAVILGIVAVMLAIGFAWYSFLKKHTDTKDMQIMTPYALYLLNGGATDTLELSVGGIHPGEVKQIVVCVSSHDAHAKEDTISKEGKFPYSLELVHTDNIGLQYNLYPLTPLNGEPETKDDSVVSSTYTTLQNDTTVVNTRYFQKGDRLTGGMTEPYTSNYRQEMYGDTLDEIVNQGIYCVYNTDNAGNSFQLSLNDENNRYNYFLIEIQWDANETEEKSKETDLVYLVAKAGVPKPVEITEEAQ